MGNNMIVARIVRIAYKFMAVKFFPTRLFIVFLLTIPRDADATLDNMA
jgi:hypothetical protein